MNKYLVIIFWLVSLILSGCGTTQTKPDYSNDIQPYTQNPRFWQYKGQPVLLLGATNNDNLFQSPDMEQQLNLLQEVGGNYVRNTMSSRDSGDEWPFYKRADGLYDLDRWNERYWECFEKLLKLANERDIIIQIEIWDRFDYSQEPWKLNPFNPAANINYSQQECGMQTEYPVHPAKDKQPFFHTLTNLPLYSPALETVKKYQQKLVDKILSYSLKYGNVLYCMNNETATPPEWGKYWMEYVRTKAGDKKIYTTDMFDSFYRPKRCKVCQDAIGNADEYLFLDISQINSRNFGQVHWDTLRYIVSERDKHQLRPLNCVKTYGGNNSGWGSGSNDDGIERFCRNAIGGCAAVRHHRPPTGNGLNEKAQAAIKALRKVESLVQLWEIKPNMQLLSDRDDNEAFLSAKEGENYVVLFPKGGSVKIDLSNYQKEFTGKWISIQSGAWGEKFRVKGGADVEIATPDTTGWFVVLTNAD